MALSPDELNQIREVVRSEIIQQRPTSSVVVRYCCITAAIIAIAVLLLHVLVIGGFTAYHLLHSP